MKRDTILFDLDGTLLPIDQELFMQEYLQAVAEHFHWLADRKTFLRHFWQATEAMIANDGRLTNAEAFWHTFTRLTEKGQEELLPHFEKYYLEVFPQLKKCCQPTPLARQVVEKALAKGYQVVLATNPLFPVEATRERMHWAGIADLPWLHVTYYDSYRSSKPAVRYFLEVCENINRPPEACFMFGNDAQEDLVATTLGITTGLVTDCLIDRGEPTYPAHWQGTLAELLDWLDQLPAL
ncbi:MAG: HAD family hydrolase [Bacillota bacterium]